MPDRARLGGEAPILPRSLWAATAIDAPATQPLRGEHRVDIAIVGAGFTGLTAALYLAERGVAVTVIDAAEPGWGASGRNNGQVIPGLKLDPDDVEAGLGPDVGTRLVRWAGELAPSLVFDLIERHGIACHPVRNGWIQPAYTRDALSVIEARCRQWRQRGAAVRILSRGDVAALLGTTAFVGGWFDPRGGSIQPLSYARGLAHAALKAGAALHGQTRALAMRRSGSQWRIETDAGLLIADKAIVATAAYSDSLVPGLKRSIIPVRTAQVATTPLSDNVLATILPGRQVASDTRRLLTSYRISPDGRLVMGGSGATGGGHTASLELHLHRAAQEIFGHITRFDWAFGWSGYLPLTKDHLPHIHEPSAALHIALGCNGRGIAVSTGMGQLLAERVLGRPADSLDVPVAVISPFRMHALRNVGIAAGTRWKRMQDRAERRRTLRRM